MLSKFQDDAMMRWRDGGKFSSPPCRFVALSLILAFLILNSACGRITFSTENTDSAVPKPTEELTQIQREIRDMQTADFKFIYVIKRKDGGEFDKADRDFLRANRTPEINRFSGTDDKKAFVVGSNYRFLPEHWENLKKRFVIEDFSKPLEEVTVEINGNQNVNK
jgi:hypothetical protein